MINQKRLGTALNLSNKMLTAFLFHWRLLIVHHIWNLSYSWKKMKRLQTGKDSPFLVSLYQIILKGYIDLSIFLCLRRGWLPFQDLYAQASNEHQVSTLISNNLWISIYYLELALRFGEDTAVSFNYLGEFSPMWTRDIRCC